jgi:hypothetical protein
MEILMCLGKQDQPHARGILLSRGFSWCRNKLSAIIINILVAQNEENL